MARRYTIGVLIGNANSPHTMELMRGIHEASTQLNVDVLFFLGIHTSYYYKALFGDDAEDNYDYQFNIVYDYAWLAKVDALVISYGSLSIYLEENNKQAFLERFRGIPYVIVEELAEEQSGTSLISDNYTGMYRIMEHLIWEHGYRRLTLLSGPKGNTDAEQRKVAFLDACAKAQIPVTEDMIAYGDYSSCVEPQVDYLLDHNPELQAIVCANDMMAMAAYKECMARGLVIGRDIAITGYDDWEMSETMIPPLTTVLQNGIHMGYTALEKAVALCKGAKPEAIYEPAVVKIRASCGCHESAKYHFPKPVLTSRGKNEAYVQGVSEIIMDEMLLSDTRREVRMEVLAQVKRIVRSNLDIYQQEKPQFLEFRTLLEQTLEQLDEKYGHYLSLNSLMDAIGAYLSNVIRHETDKERINIIMGVMRTAQRAIQSLAIKSGKEQINAFRLDTWLIPLISRDMMNHIDKERDFYGAALAKISTIKAKRAYLYIFEKPMIHHRSEKWECPDKLYLAVSNEGNGVQYYDPQERPVITREKGFAGQLRARDSYTMSVFSLFSGEVQYGILVCEILPQDMPLTYQGSMQISIALSFFELSKQQRETQRKLERVVQEINEKNEILGFISEYDQLTGCLNRRGFMEKAVHFCKENQGQRCMLLFADLDHLKQINDHYGHSAGDFAIQTAAQILKSSLGSASYIARIGGDEYVALVPITNNVSAENVLHEIHLKNEDFNQMSKKPFYVEVSVGYTDFMCSQDMALSAIIDEADRYLYDAKKERRESIVKIS